MPGRATATDGSMRAGPLRQRVTLQRGAEGRDAYGQVVRTWTDVGTYWAEVSPGKGAERAVAMQLRADSPALVTLRYAVPILTTDRLAYRGRNLNILNVNVLDERRRAVELLCDEVTTAAKGS